MSLRRSILVGTAVGTAAFFGPGIVLGIFLINEFESFEKFMKQFFHFNCQLLRLLLNYFLEFSLTFTI